MVNKKTDKIEQIGTFNDDMDKFITAKGLTINVKDDVPARKYREIKDLVNKSGSMDLQDGTKLPEFEKLQNEIADKVFETYTDVTVDSLLDDYTETDISEITGLLWVFLGKGVNQEGKQRYKNAFKAIKNST